MNSKLIAVITFLTPAVPAIANDTNLPAGGSPKQLATHRSVSMQSEYVRVDVGDEVITVDCNFTFRNNGAACKVRMGFPDESGEGDPDEPVPAKGFFRTFKSWVNGKPVKTSVVKSGEPGQVWHVKEVRFPARSTVKVRDRYTVDVGSSVAADPLVVKMARYVLHTGASWHGKIGLSVVNVTFHTQNVKGPLKVKEITYKNDQPSFAKEATGDKREVFYSGPCKAMIRGKGLRFEVHNWRPEPEDDILVVFAARRVRPAQELSGAARN